MQPRAANRAVVRALAQFVLPSIELARDNPAPSTMAKRTKRIQPNALHLIVASVPRSVAFYTDKLGFQLVEAHPDTSKPVWASVALGGQSVMLGELPTLVEARQRGMEQEQIELLKQDARSFARGAIGIGASYYLRVKNVDAFARRLKKKRVRPLVAPTTQPYGWRECHLADLDGYRLVVYMQVKAAEIPAPPADA